MLRTGKGEADVDVKNLPPLILVPFWLRQSKMIYLFGI